MKTNRISKLIVFTLISMFSFSSYSQQNPTIEFSLKCKVKVEYSDFTGYKRTDNSEAIVEVKEIPKTKDKVIFMKSINEFVNNIAVTTILNSKKNNSEAKGSDLSDDSKYEITYSTYDTNRNTNTDTMIYLNRNNGEVIVTKEFSTTQGKSQILIGGTCEKIDRTKKKF